MKVDLHIHSYRSPDGNMSLDTIIRTCQQRGIGCIALTDHNQLSAALDLQKIAPFYVIAGEEIKTTYGEIIGLFLQEEIPKGLSPGSTVEAIRSQGGAVYIPHPFDRVRKSVLDKGALMEIVDMVDVIEVFNARITFKADILAAENFAIEHRKLMGAGSDAHVWWEIGGAYMEMPEFKDGKEGFLAALSHGTINGKLASPSVHLASSFNKWWKKYFLRR